MNQQGTLIRISQDRLFAKYDAKHGSGAAMKATLAKAQKLGRSALTRQEEIALLS